MTTELIIKGIFALLGVIVTYFLIPFLREKVEGQKMDQFLAYVEWAVRWAEQVYTDEQNERKKREVVLLVTDYLGKINLDLNEEEVDAIIEGIVNLVKKSLNEAKS